MKVLILLHNFQIYVWMFIINFFSVQSLSFPQRFIADFYRPKYQRWSNSPIELSCPLSEPNRRFWYSSEAVYEIVFGCLEKSPEFLRLPRFPDVANITAVAENSTHFASCTFSLVGELIRAEAYISRGFPGNSHTLFNVDLYTNIGSKLYLNTTICKKGKVRNGSCSSSDETGQPFTGIQVNKRYEQHYDVRYEVMARAGDRHQCMVSIDDIDYSVGIFIKADLNECFLALDDFVELCEKDCHNLLPGYRCSENSYSIPCSDISRDDWICLPNNRLLYPPIEMEVIGGVGICEMLANDGLSVCPDGIQDCVDSPDGQKCRSNRNSIALNDVAVVPKTVPNVNLLLRKAATDKNITYMLTQSAPILYRNPEAWIETFNNISAETLQRPSVELFHMTKDVSSENLLQSMDALLNLPRQIIEVPLSDTTSDEPIRGFVSDSTQHAVERPKTKPPVLTASVIIRSASALLNVFSALSGSKHGTDGRPHILPEEFTMKKHGLELRRIRLTKDQTRIKNDSIVIHSLSNTSDLATALMVTIPATKLRPFLEHANWTDAAQKSSEFNFTNLDSDVYIIHSMELNSLLELKISTVEEHENDVNCKVWDMLNNGPASESDECKTHWIGGKDYECRCYPKRSGTFAVGLVFILSSRSLKDLRNYGSAITIINYVCSVITIIALFMFLLFTRFVGVFRLDQFHIALCLLLSTIVAIFVAHIPEDQHFLCASFAVLVNFFPLCAFAWKFVFGLNALLMIVAPHSNFNDMISLRVFYIPVTVCAYLGPALIVSFWFGMARQFKSGLGLCIGPDLLGYRWPLLAPITTVVLFNFVVLLIVAIVVLRNYLAIRHSRINKTTHLLVLIQLMLTLGIPYMLIYVQIISPLMMLLILPIGIALTAVFMFLLVAVIDDENRILLRLFLQTMCAPKYSSSGPGGTVKTTLASDFALSNHNNNSINERASSHHFFARSRNQFARSVSSSVDRDSVNGILVHSPANNSFQRMTNSEERLKPVILVPLEVPRLYQHYQHHNHFHTSPKSSPPIVTFDKTNNLMDLKNREL